MAVDKFDVGILKVLQGDARASLQDISKRVALSPTPCWNRIKKMEADGLIQGGWCASSRSPRRTCA